MASRKSPASPASPALPEPPASSGSKRHVELIPLEASTIEEIISYIVSARQRDSESILSFQWQACQVDGLFKELDARLIELDELEIRRFEYDYQSETVYLDIRGESEFHYQVQAGLRDHLKNRVAKLRATTDDPAMRQLMRSIHEMGPFLIKYKSKIRKQADVSFGPGEPRQYVERKARQYIDFSDGNIRAVLIIDLEYPDMKKAWVSLLVADDSSTHWVQHSQTFHDDGIDQQPSGQVGLYVSDFLGLSGLPAAFCRPSSAELAAGTTRNPTITLTYERLRAIFRLARHLHNPTKFTTEVGDEEENPYEEVERRVAEARVEMERRVAEERTEMQQRMAEERIQTQQRMIEMERRMAGGRLEAE